MSNDLEDFDFDFNISSINDITNDIDDDVLSAILNENEMSDNSLQQTLSRFDDKFLDSLKDCNEIDFKEDFDNKDLDEDLSNNIEEVPDSLLFDTQEESIISNIAENLEGIDKSFDPFIIEALSVPHDDELTKEKQMKNINEYSKTLQSTFQELKQSKQKTKKRNCSTAKYRDLSDMTEEQVCLRFKSMVGRSQESFPVKLYKIIDRIERDGLSSIISWLPHGRAFRIHDTGRFVKEVMTCYFYQTKMSSFTRQLGT